MDEQEIDTSNDFFVGVDGDYLTVMRHPQRLTKAEALRLAAWLVVLADPMDELFPSVRRAIENT